MSSAARDPSKLTISQLKLELTKQGVQFPKDARKAEYVRLYTTCMKESRSRQRATRATPRRPPSSRIKAQTPQRSAVASAGFSSGSDEEKTQIRRGTTSRTQQMPRRGKQQTEYEKNLEVVQSLTDKELRDELAYYSVSAAITRSTRGLFEKKLAKLLGGEKPPPPPAPAYDDEDEDDEEEEEEEYSDSEPEEVQRISERGDARRRTQTPSAARHRTAAAAETVSQEQQTSPGRAAVVEEERSGVSFWLQCLILFIVLLLIFLVWSFFKTSQGQSAKPELTQNV